MSGALKRDEWKTVRLGDVATYVSDRIDASLLDTHNYVSVENLLADRRGIKDSENVPQTGRFIQYVSGDVLIGNIRPYLKKIWLAIHEGGTNGDVLVIRPNNSKNLSSEYLYHSLASDVFFNYAMQNAKGAKMPRGDKKLIMKYSFPLPPLDIQRRIADTLDKVTELITLRKTQLKKLDELVKARFVEMFGDPLNDTAKYPLHQVGEVAEAIDPQPSHRTPPIEEGGIPYVSIKDCDYKTGIIDFDGARKVSRTVLEEHLNRYILQDGDFIIGKIGTIGKPVFVPARNDYTLSANIVLVQPNSKLVSPCFLKYSFESDFVERQFTEAKNSTSQAAFGIQKVRAVEVMNPELDVQRDFERFVEQTDKSKVIIQQSLDTLETLKKSLMQEYFG